VRAQQTGADHRPARRVGHGGGPAAKFSDAKLKAAIDAHDTLADAYPSLGGGGAQSAIRRYINRQRFGVEARAAHTKVWTERELEMLREEWSKDLDDKELPRRSAREIAEMFGTTTAALTSVISRYGIASKDGKKRECKMCEKPFWSDSVGNRICAQCKMTELYRCSL
jgi:hypothetical protein